MDTEKKEETFYLYSEIIDGSEELHLMPFQFDFEASPYIYKEIEEKHGIISKITVPEGYFNDINGDIQIAVTNDLLEVYDETCSGFSELLETIEQGIKSNKKLSNIDLKTLKKEKGHLNCFKNIIEYLSFPEKMNIYSLKLDDGSDQYIYFLITKDDLLTVQNEIGNISKGISEKYKSHTIRRYYSKDSTPEIIQIGTIDKLHIRAVLDKNNTNIEEYDTEKPDENRFYIEYKNPTKPTKRIMNFANYKNNSEKEIRSLFGL